MPFQPLYLLFLILLGGVFVFLVQLGVLSIAFEKLGLSSASASALFFVSLAGSFVNLPLFTVRTSVDESVQVPMLLRRLWREAAVPFPGRTLVTINVGGGLVPLAFSAYLVAHTDIASWQWLVAVGCVTLVSYVASRPMPGIGIAMPVFVAPVAAALTAVMINPESSAQLAYVGGVFGVLVGADILRLKDVKRLAAPVASIGGAGTFDGIYITGLVAVLLA